VSGRPGSSPHPGPSIGSTCHPILPGRAASGPAVTRRRRALGRNAAWRGWAAARQGRTRPCGRPPTPTSGDRPVAGPSVAVGADLGRCVAWFLRLLDNYALGASAEPWTSGLQRWTEPAERRYHHVERAAATPEPSRTPHRPSSSTP